MNTILVVTIIITVSLTWIGAAWLDVKRNWRLIDWFAGKTDNPFKSTHAQQLVIREKDKHITELTERIQALEKIVTEPAYELNKKINQL